MSRLRAFIKKEYRKFQYGKYINDVHFFPRVRPYEIYLISYPRSGNTWVRCIVTEILHGGPITPEIIQNTVPDVYLARQEGQDKPSISPLIIKSHSQYRHIPAKVIYLIRDPRKAVVSYYIYEQKKADTTNKNCSIQAEPITIRDFFFGITPYGSWHEHVLGWLSGLEKWNKDRYLVVRYEDILSEPFLNFKAILKFIGISPSETEIRNALKHNTIEKMIKLENDSNVGSLNYPGTRKPNWKELLSECDRSEFSRIAAPALDRLNYPR